MKSNIEPLYYYDENIFEHEKETLFSKNWNFVGFQQQLLNPNDYVTRTIADVPVVIQNFRGRIRAFLNICSHRFSKLQQDDAGNRALVCPYHGWAYDAEGIPTGIPKKPLFKDFTHDELCELRLKEYKVEFCGALCFVSLATEPQSLEAYLGDFYLELKKMSQSLGRMIDVNQMKIEANWKVIVENTLESYHVASIHPNTFKKLGAQGMSFEFTSDHSLWSANLNVNREDKANRKIEELFAGHQYKIDGYKHFLVFPNLLISSTHGSSFNYSLVEPLSSGLTNFTSYVFTAMPAVGKTKALLTAFEKSLVDFNRQVFMEDKTICQLVQVGVKQTVLQGVLSLEEERVHAFQNVYKNIINNGSSH